jgi:alpha-glucosidase
MMNMRFTLLLLVCVWGVLGVSEYRVVNETRNASAVTLALEYFGPDEFYLKPKSPIAKRLAFVLQTLTFDEFTFRVTDPNKARFEVPQGGVFPEDPYRNFSFPLASSAITFEYAADPFDFRVLRKENGAVLFSTFNRTMVYSDKYIEIGTQLDTRFIFGLGERLAQSFIVREGRWSMFPHDFGGVIDPGLGFSTYGYYPFYLMREKNSLFHVCYYRTSSPMDAVTQIRNNTHYITFKSIGGIIDFRFFLGDSNP